ncbi:unnamed protein product [Lactuca virosa]|uniref:Uncharacterized protein n=1 Tax=Lactuca virosa TaxID=75947 RepID=A0AAU9LKX1_9ASTR|nr:unnamed protein product [Lactuca virosa]
MLKKVNPTHKVLVKYLKTINPDVETGVLLEVEAGSSKQSKKSKVNEAEVPATRMNKPKSKSPKKKEDVEVTKEKEVVESKKELIPSKSGVLKRLRKTQLSRKGVVVREIHAPVSPLSKKGRVDDVAKHITEKRYKRKLVIRDDSSENDVVADTPPVLSSPMVTLSTFISYVSPTPIITPSTSIPLEIVVTKSIFKEVPISNCWILV